MHLPFKDFIAIAFPDITGVMPRLGRYRHRPNLAFSRVKGVGSGEGTRMSTYLVPETSTKEVLKPSIGWMLEIGTNPIGLRLGTQARPSPRV